MFRKNLNPGNIFAQSEKIGCANVFPLSQWYDWAQLLSKLFILDGLNIFTGNSSFKAF